MNTEPAKHDDAEERETPQAIAEQRTKHSPATADGEDSARVGLLRITRPLDITSDDMGGDPYNSTGRFTRKED